MSDGLFQLLVIVICLLLLTVFGLGTWTLRQILNRAVQPEATQSEPVPSDPIAQRQQRLLAKARAACGQKACCNCKNWDLEAGQRGIAENPNFVAAARHLTPNRMGRRADEPTLSSLPVALDTWELFGACGVDNYARHATDNCDQFEKA